jgi:predicted MarR family transcription regulator
MERNVTMEQTREYLIHIISNLDGYTLDSICEYLDIYDTDIEDYFMQKVEKQFDKK